MCRSRTLVIAQIFNHRPATTEKFVIIPLEEELAERLSRVLDHYTQTKWLIPLLDIAGQPRRPLGILRHLRFTSADCSKDLLDVDQRAGQSFEINEQIFSCFFPDQEAGKSCWQSLQVN